MLDNTWEKLSSWARRHGLNYKTAWRMAKTATLPSGVQVKQLPTGTWYVKEEETQLDRIEHKLDSVLERLK